MAESEQLAFRRLAVFPGKFDVDAAESACAGGAIEASDVLGLLGSLVDKSLVLSEPRTEKVRYRLLETIREFALERLSASSEADEVRRCHRDHFLAKVARPLTAAELEDDLDNFRTAFQWSLEVGDADEAARLVTGWQPLWQFGGRMTEGRRRYDPFFDRPEALSLPVRARTFAAGSYLESVAIGDETIARADAAVAVAREVGDENALTVSLVSAATAMLQQPFTPESLPTIKALASEAEDLARRSENDWLLQLVLYLKGFAATLDGPAAARPHFEEMYAIAERLGASTLNARAALAQTAAEEGEIDDALASACVIEREARAAGDLFAAVTALIIQAHALAAAARTDDALSAGAEAVRLADELGMASLEAQARVALGSASLAAGDAEAARDRFLAAAAVRGTSHGVIVNPILGDWRVERAEAELACGDTESARRLLDDWLAAPGARHLRLMFANALVVRARIACAEDDLRRAEDVAHQALAALLELRVQSGVADSFELLGGLAINQESYEEGVRLLAAASAIRDSNGHRRFAVHERAVEEVRRSAIAALGEEAFERASAEGAAMTLPEAASYAARGRGKRKRPSTGWASLTPSELDVARLVGDGLANPEIATRLFISPRTVNAHLTSVYRKTGLTSRLQLAQEAIRRR